MNIGKRLLLLNNSGGDTIKFILLSDAHVIAEAADDPSYPNLTSPPMYFYTARKKLEIVKNKINEIEPDAVLFLGDAINYQGYEDSFDMFMQYWNAIDPNIPKSISAGNHDYAYNADYDTESHGMSLEEYTAYKLGYGDRTTIAGSKFNESFSVNSGSLSVRFINFDTNWDSNYRHSSSGGYIPSDEIAWIRSVLASSTDDVVFLYSHRGASKGATSYLNATDREAFENMLVSVSQENPKPKIIYLYGHSHTPQLWQGYTNIGNFETYNCSALVDNASSQYYVFTVNKNGVVSIETLWANYNAV